MPGAPVLLSLAGIHKRFASVHALDDVALEIAAGEVHAVVGENGAGKSTLINILAGELQPDDGTLTVGGQPARFASPHASQRLGIRVVHQELALCPNLTVSENIGMQEIAGRAALRLRDRSAAAATARAALAQLGAGHLPLHRPVQRLRIAEQQLVEIAKAITQDVRLLVLDEPNSALTAEESEHLFRVVRDLRARGVSVLYVSHRLEEVLALADRITVMRDGRVITTLQAADASIDRLITLMVGRAVDSLLRRDGAHEVRATAALEVRRLSDPKLLRDVAFTVHQGEVLGIAGLPGSGKDELVECLFGLRPHTGEIRRRGAPVRITSAHEAIAHGLALIPADRRGAGAFLVMNIRQNVIAASLERVATLGFLRRRASAGVAERYFRELDMRASGLGQRVGTLSGGNQQKVVLAKGLATGPEVLLLHEPTRGIDVGAKAEIYAILQGLAREGRAVVVVSSEMPELIGQCDRMLVMHEGRISGVFDRTEFDEERILACAMGQAVHLPGSGVAA